MRQAKLETARRIATTVTAVATVLLLAACQTSSPQNTNAPASGAPMSGVNSEGPAYNSGGALNSPSTANTMGGAANSLGPVNRVEPTSTRAKANKL